MEEYNNLVWHRQNDELQELCSKIDALAFLPVGNVLEEFQHLQATCPLVAVPLLEYFDITYVTDGHGGQPVFLLLTWNVFQQAVNDDPRTNNLVEEWNNRFRTAIVFHHPTTTKVIEWLRKEAVEVETVIAQDPVGTVKRKRVRQEYVTMQR